MIGLAILGVTVNGIAVWRMRQGGKSLNEEMISWHLLEDVLGWVAVLLGAIVMYFFEVPWIDPLLSILIMVFILRGVLKNLWKASQIILQASPADLDVQKVKEVLEKIKGVDNAHHLHLWTLDGETNLLSAHIETDGNQKVVDLKSIKKAIYETLEDHFHIDHITLEFETEGECGEDSTFCK
jgi:cobalt-zinc-cadmium efflux system protein